MDVIGILTESTDARNYWKVLKNRLNKRQSELVTRCNQLKMKAKDGKYYFTDTADEETMIHIIESMPRKTFLRARAIMEDSEEVDRKEFNHNFIINVECECGIQN